MTNTIEKKRNFYSLSELDSYFIDVSQLDKLSSLIDFLLIEEYLPILSIPTHQLLDILKVFGKISYIFQSDNFCLRNSYNKNYEISEANLFLCPVSFNYVQSFDDIVELIEDYSKNSDFSKIVNNLMSTKILLELPIIEYFFKIYDYILDYELKKLNYFLDDIQANLASDQEAIKRNESNKAQFQSLMPQINPSGDELMGKLLTAMFNVPCASISQISTQFIEENQENIKLLESFHENINKYSDRLASLRCTYYKLIKFSENNKIKDLNRFSS